MSAHSKSETVTGERDNFPTLSLRDMSAVLGRSEAATVYVSAALCMYLPLVRSLDGLLQLPQTSDSGSITQCDMASARKHRSIDHAI